MPPTSSTLRKRTAVKLQNARCTLMCAPRTYPLPSARLMEYYTDEHQKEGLPLGTSVLLLL